MSANLWPNGLSENVLRNALYGYPGIYGMDHEQLKKLWSKAMRWPEERDHLLNATAKAIDHEVLRADVPRETD
jgi:hypothetical protein